MRTLGESFRAENAVEACKKMIGKTEHVSYSRLVHSHWASIELAPVYPEVYRSHRGVQGETPTFNFDGIYNLRTDNQRIDRSERKLGYQVDWCDFAR